MNIKGFMLGLAILILACGNAYAQSTPDYDEYDGLIGFTFSSSININYGYDDCGLGISSLGEYRKHGFSQSSPNLILTSSNDLFSFPFNKSFSDNLSINKSFPRWATALLNIVPGFGLGSLLQGNMGGAFVQFLYQGLIPVTSFTRVYLIYGFAYILNLPMTDDTDDYWKSVNGIALDAMLSSFLVASPFAITTGIISAIMYKPGLPNEIINTIYLNQLTLIGLGSYFQGDRIGGVIQTSLFISCFVFNLIGSILVDPLYYYISIGILALDLTAGIIFPFIKGDNVSID